MPNPTGKGGWAKGQSGNPNGRPKKDRVLTAILKRAGSRTREDVDGKRRSGKRIIARALWELASTGCTVLPREDGKSYQIAISGDGWFDEAPECDPRLLGPYGGPLHASPTWRSLCSKPCRNSACAIGCISGKEEASWSKETSRTEPSGNPSM